jgi:hypothetical protein
MQEIGFHQKVDYPATATAFVAEVGQCLFNVTILAIDGIRVLLGA